MSEKRTKEVEQEAEPQPDFVLKDGTEIDFDLEKVTVEEYRALFKPGATQEVEDELVARVAGLKKEAFGKMSLKEYKKFVQAFYAKAVNPLAD
jgi:hypothetical protein